MSSSRIRVAGPRPYDVLVGRDLLGEVLSLLGPDVRRVAVVHPGGGPDAVSAVTHVLRSGGIEVLPVAVPDGEAAKCADVAAECWHRLGEVGFTRSDAVVGVGGGATTDLAGFVAATFLRGIRVVHVPTTLLGMVDAAVGGKTGINTEEGKNLVGAFHEPAGVLCDLDALRTLPRAEIASGLAEVAKCGFVADPAILALLETHGGDATDPASPTLRELVERAVSVKAHVVAGDLTEATSTRDQVGREVLNYGHTFGHAVERVEDYAVRHGEAVAVGMVYVAELARLAGTLDPDVVRRHRAVLESLHLPTTYPDGRWDRLHAVMRRDKKTRGKDLRFVALADVGHPVILHGPDDALLRAAYAAVHG